MIAYFDVLHILKIYHFDHYYNLGNNFAFEVIVFQFSFWINQRGQQNPSTAERPKKATEADESRKRADVPGDQENLKEKSKTFK